MHPNIRFLGDTMKIWLDDIRPAPDGWFWVKDAVTAIAIIKKDGFIVGDDKFPNGYENAEDVTEISFDHDLGPGYEGNTGYRVACLIEQLAAHNQIKPIKWTIHSANPVGRKNIEWAMKNAEKFWKENGHD